MLALGARRQQRPVFRLLARAATALVLGWLLLAGGLAAARRLANATRPLSPGELVGAAIGLAIVAHGARTAWTSGRGASGWRGGLPLAATSLAVVLWGISLVRGVGSPAAAAFFWMLLIGEEGWALAGRKKRRAPLSRSEGAAGELVLQQFTRFLTEAEEVVRGSLTVTVEGGSRVSAGHVAFCPPMVQRPQFEVQPDSTTNATLKVSQLHPHGARIDVRLSQAAQTDTPVRLHFVARASRQATEPGPRSAD